jgi:WD40 repeat protein
VYQIRFSQRWPSVFLSCSADWTVGVYHLKNQTPLLSIRATGEDYPITDVAWCPGNSTVFACVSADAKLQIWDLSVSSIDPVVNVDVTTLGMSEDGTTSGAAADLVEDDEADHQAAGLSPSKTMSSRFDTAAARALGTESGATEAIGGSAVNRLLKQLSVESKKKSLTCLQFGDHTPTIAVGDNRGTVTVYRVFDPVAITHQGPLQQTTKLKKAVMQLVDPATAAVLTAAAKLESAQGADSKVDSTAQ